MNIHLRIGDNRSFALKQAVLLYQDGSKTFATLHEVKLRPDEAPYLCAGQPVTAGFLETLAKGLGASMGAEVLPDHVLARTPELIAWWSPAQPRLMFFGEGNTEAKHLNGKTYPQPPLVFMIYGRELFVRALAEDCRPKARYRRCCPGRANSPLRSRALCGQFVLGEPLNRRNRRHRLRLRTVSELFPEVIESDLDGDGLPSCSAAEALDRQEPFVNPTLANHALALLARLFRYGTISYHGAFVSLSGVGGVQMLRVDPTCWQRLRKKNRHTLNIPTRKDRSNGTNAAEQ
jgi:hypothetical protein